jgi:iron(III) transport system ATP-binding protein
MGIVVRDLQKAFGSGQKIVEAVRNLSLDVHDGELLVVLGPSGSGKTTLLRCIAGLERPDAGEIIVDGRVVYSSVQRAWVAPERRGISMVFQSYALWPHMSAFENVAYPLRAGGIGGTALRERVARVLKLVGCDGLEDRHPSELSGGQQQRIAVARAVVSGSRVVLFDEPLSSVDARVREELRHELVALQQELRFSAVYITHDQTEAMAIGHRVAVLANGEILQVAAPRDLYARPISSYIAEFMGATNQFEGAISSVDDGNYSVRTEIGGIIAARTSLAVTVDTPVVVIIRSEDCELIAQRPNEDHMNAWRGTVRRSLFLGPFTEYVVDVGKRVVSVRSASISVIPDGTPVWLVVPPIKVGVVAK